MTPTVNAAGARPAYYPYIDGLRAFAVLSVLIYHLHGPWLPGGFVGVDVFFVISGFVVSASIAAFKGQGLGAFLGWFYARRIKRIFPALIVCLLLTAWVTTLLVPSSWLSAVNQQTGLYAFFGLSNFILASTGRDYFAPTTEFNPYTHTWSLAVEEQFYLIFPFLFIAWVAGGRGRRLSIALFVVGLLASFAWAAWYSQSSPTQAYFLTPSRFWELAAGVLLYQLTVARGPQAVPGAVHRWVAPLALLAMLAAFVVSTPENFPVPGALLAVLGTLGVIWSLHNHSQLRALHSLLGSRALVAVGKISYSLYLWHWPVFVLFRWTVGLDSGVARLAAVALAFVLAIASWRFIENPVRHARSLRGRSEPAVIVAGLLLVVVSWSGARWLSDHQHELSLSTLSQNREVWYPHGAPNSPEHPGCQAEPEHHDVEGGLLLIYSPKGCVEPRPLQKASVYAIGDSHALAYEGMFKQYAIRQSARVYAYNNGGCPFISLQPGRDIDNPQCRHHAEAALRDIRQRIQPGDILFLPSLRLGRFSDQWAYFGEEGPRIQMLSPQAEADRQRAIAAAVATLREFAERGVHILFEAPKPLFRAPPFRCGDRFNRNNPICAYGFEMERELLDELRAPVLAAFAEIARQVPGVEVWDPLPVLCPQGAACSAWRGENPLFLDGDHLSGYGNAFLLPSFTAALQPLLAAPLPQSSARSQALGH